MTDKVHDFHQRRDSAVSKLLRMRSQSVDELEFGRLAAIVLDDLAFAEEMNGWPQYGIWDKDELKILRDAYASNSPDPASEACKNLNRSRGQVTSMASTLRIRRWD